MLNNDRAEARPIHRTAQTLSLAFLALALFLMTGCGPRWQVVKQASSMGPDSKFNVEKPTFANLSVGGMSEENYQGRKDAQERAKWQEGKAALMDAYAAAYREKSARLGVATTPAEGFTVRANIPWIEPGYWAVIAGKPTEVKVKVEIVDKNGVVQDVINMGAMVPVGITTTSFRGRLADIGKDLGHQIAEYLKMRATHN